MTNSRKARALFPIHVHQDVAPLKPLFANLLTFSLAYPRPSGRGSIEASGISQAIQSSKAIQVHQDVAPLKRFVPTDGFRQPFRAIHVHQDVAPLKQVVAEKSSG